MKKITAILLATFSLLALCLVSWGSSESTSVSDADQWSSPAAAQSFNSDGDIDGLTSDQEIYSTALVSTTVEMYQQYTSGACSRSTGCSTGCSVGCSTGCSVGCKR